MRRVILLLILGSGCRATSSKSPDPVTPARIVVVSDCRLTQPPPKKNVDVNAAIDKRGRNLTDIEADALGSYLAASVAYNHRAWRLCGTVEK